MNLGVIAKDLGLEEEEYLELWELFRETCISDLDKIQSAVEAEDAKMAAKAAHSIRGAAINLGLMELHEAAREIEVETSNGRLQGITENAQALKNNLDLFTELLRDKKLPLL